MAVTYLCVLQYLNLEATSSVAEPHFFNRDCSLVATSTFLACVSVIDISLNTDSHFASKSLNFIAKQLGSYRSDSGRIITCIVILYIIITKARNNLDNMASLTSLR